jgi:hypothetical protein
MLSLKDLEQKKQDIAERNDLPIQDFVGWDGWERMIDSHIEALKRIENIKEMYGSNMSDEEFINELGDILEMK